MKKIISQNFNSWCPVNARITQSDKIKLFADYIKNKYDSAVIIAVQEFITGGGKYLDELYEAFDKEYFVVVPPCFDYRTHARSLVTVTLLKKSSTERFEVRDLGKSLPNRISYIVAWIEGTPWTIINIYAVQIANFTGKAEWYAELRRRQHHELWQEILSEAWAQKDDSVIILGDFQESSKGSHIRELTEMGYIEIKTGLPTVRNCFFKQWNIDHILFSKKAWNDFYPISMDYDGNLLDELSDHILLAAVTA